jgi:hypothetical protein
MNGTKKVNNYKDALVGKRIKLLKTMTNDDSIWMPEEDLPVGLEGTITHVSIHGSKKFDQISVKWDNGRILGILPYKDDYQIL